MSLQRSLCEADSLTCQGKRIVRDGSTLAVDGQIGNGASSRQQFARLNRVIETPWILSRPATSTQASFSQLFTLETLSSSLLTNTGVAWMCRSFQNWSLTPCHSIMRTISAHVMEIYRQMLMEDVIASDQLVDQFGSNVRTALKTSNWRSQSVASGAIFSCIHSYHAIFCKVCCSDDFYSIQEKKPYTEVCQHARSCVSCIRCQYALFGVSQRACANTVLCSIGTVMPWL